MPRSNPKTRLRMALGIVVTTFIFYAPATQNGFVWDDNKYVTENLALRDAAGLEKIWFHASATPQYYPVVHTVFWAEYHLWQLNPFGYHCVNILVHALNALLVWLVLRKLSVPFAWFAALVFAIHPVQVESVAWITELKNTLSGLFYLLSLLAFLKFDDAPESPSSTKKELAWKYYAASLLYFVLALLSKTVTAGLPVIIVLISWWKGRKIEGRFIALLAPYLVLGLCMGLHTAYLEKHHVLAEGKEWSYSLVEHVLIAGRIVWFYIGKLILPIHLTFIYSKWNIDYRAGWQYVFPLATVAVAAAGWMLRGKIGKGFLTAFLAFIATLAPALGFFNVYPMRYSFVADHFQYLAMIAPVSLLSAGMAKWFMKSKSPKTTDRPITPIAIVILLGILTWNQTKIFQNLDTLWSDTIRKNPGAWMAHNNMGALLLGRGQYREAVAEFKECLRLNPEHAGAHYNLGNAYYYMSLYEPAVREYTTALKGYPNSAEIYFNLGVVFDKLKRTENAMEAYQTAVRLDPGHFRAMFNLGMIYATQGRLTEAVSEWKNVLRWNPNDNDALNNIRIAQNLLDTKKLSR